MLRTVLAPLGRRAAITRDPAAAGGAALAYAAEPVAGVPTIPCDAGAMELIAAGRALPAGAFAARGSGDGAAVAAWPADPGAGFAVPFDLVASAFVLLACWDERTTSERDRFDRLPFSASVFAANPALKIDEPAVDRYAELLRGALAPRLAELGLEPLPTAGALWGARGRFAIALTHDLDNLWRWTRREFAASGYRTARAACRLDGRAARPRAGRSMPTGCCATCRGARTRSGRSPRSSRGEDVRGVSSTFYVIARHTHKQDGIQPAVYRQRIPRALALVTDAGREVGLHGNDADRLDARRPHRGPRRPVRARGRAVTGVRYHYLRALYHETLPMLEKAGFTYDTTLAFAEHEGFRCGCSFPFRPYSLAEERPLDLVELPLAVMDSTLQDSHYRSLAAEDAEFAAASVLARALRSGGAVSLLWHNNRFDRRVSRGYDKVYWRLLDQALARGAWCTSAADVVARWNEATA